MAWTLADMTVMGTRFDTPAPNDIDGCRCPEVEIQVQGELAVGAVARMQERLLDALSLKPHRLVVDLSGCTFFDATGINLLLDVHRRAWRQSANLALRGCSERHLRILALMGLNGVFDVEEGHGPGRVRPLS